MTDHVPAPVVDDDLREQMRPIIADLAQRRDPDAEDVRRVLAELLPVVTAHVAAERERAVAEAVEPIRALLDSRRSLDLTSYPSHHAAELSRPIVGVVNSAWRDAIRAALPAQSADQAQETGHIATDPGYGEVYCDGGRTCECPPAGGEDE